MKMAIAGLRSRLLCSSSSLFRNRNLLCRRVFSAAEEHNRLEGSKINLESKQLKFEGVGLMGDAQRSEPNPWMIMLNAVFRASPSLSWLFRKQNLPTHAPNRLTNINLESKQLKSDGMRLLDDAQRCKDWESFKSWMSKVNKKYESEEEMLYRFGIFREKLKLIEKLNNKKSGCTFGLNHYSDLTFDEVPKGGCSWPPLPRFTWNGVLNYFRP